MLRKHRTRLVILSIALAVVTGVAIVFGIVVLPVVLQSRREAKHWKEVNKQLEQMSQALERHTKRTAASVSHEARLPFATYSGYFVSNKFEPNAPESFVVLANQEQFDKVFGVATVMGNRPHRLPKDAFTGSVVLATIKRGTAVWDFEVEGVTVNDGVVELRYTTTSKKNDSATFACPLIISVPKGKYLAVQFVEDKKTVATIDIGKK
jgi:hypothetical protein